MEMTIATEEQREVMKYALEPDNLTGYGYLEVIRNVFGN